MVGGGEGRGTAYIRQCGETPPKSGAIFTLKVYEKVGKFSDLQCSTVCLRITKRHFKLKEIAA